MRVALGWAPVVSPYRAIEAEHDMIVDDLVPDALDGLPADLALTVLSGQRPARDAPSSDFLCGWYQGTCWSSSLGLQTSVLS